MNDTTRRKGSVLISRDFISKDIEICFLLFQNFFPVHIANNDFNNTIEYFGYSKLFDVVEDGVQPPRYDAMFSKDKADKVTFDCFVRL